MASVIYQYLGDSLASKGVQTAVKIEEEAIDVTIAVKQEKDSGLVVVGKRKENGNGSVMSVEAKKTTVKRKTTSHANLKLRHAAFKYLIRWIPDNTGDGGISGSITAGSVFSLAKHLDEAGFTSAPTSLISLPDPLTLLDLGHGTGRLAFDVQAALPCIRRIIGIELDPIVCDISRFVRDKLVTNLMKKASQLSPSSSSQSKSKRSDNDNESRESDLDRNHDHDSGGETDDGDNGDGGNGGSDLADLIPLPDTLFHQGDILKIDTYEGIHIIISFNSGMQDRVLNHALIQMCRAESTRVVCLTDKAKIISSLAKDPEIRNEISKGVFTNFSVSMMGSGESHTMYLIPLTIERKLRILSAYGFNVDYSLGSGKKVCNSGSVGVKEEGRTGKENDGASSGLKQEFRNEEVGGTADKNGDGVEYRPFLRKSSRIRNKAKEKALGASTEIGKYNAKKGKKAGDKKNKKSHDLDDENDVKPEVNAGDTIDLFGYEREIMRKSRTRRRSKK